MNFTRFTYALTLGLTMMGGALCLSGCKTTVRKMGGPDRVEDWLRIGVSHPFADTRRPGIDIRETREFRVMARQVGYIMAGNPDPVLYPAEAAIILTGKPSAPPWDGMNRANLLFYGSHKPDYVGKVKLDGPNLWIYLPMSDFEKVRDLMDGHGEVRVIWTRFSDERQEAAIVHH